MLGSSPGSALYSSFLLIRETAEDDSSTWFPAVHVGDLDGVLEFWLQPDPTLPVVGFWKGVNQQVEGFALSLSLSVCLSPSPSAFQTKLIEKDVRPCSWLAERTPPCVLELVTPAPSLFCLLTAP